MAWFQNMRAKKELDSIIHELDVSLANNYKSVAHDNRKNLIERTEALFHEGKLKDKDYLEYRKRYETYTQVMKDYHH